MSCVVVEWSAYVCHARRVGRARHVVSHRYLHPLWRELIQGAVGQETSSAYILLL